VRAVFTWFSPVASSAAGSCFPSAQAAELTSGHYRLFEKEGLEARVDLASQVLQLNVPEEKQLV
jgi:hypothetical protein